jgi:hypothetical protein
MGMHGGSALEVI